MKTYDDLPRMKQSIRASWRAYALMIAIFGIIALRGWLLSTSGIEVQLIHP
jgi:hypothetical protein